MLERPFFPIAAVAAILITLFSESSAALPDLWRPLVVSLVAAGLVQVLAGVIVRNPHIGGIVATSLGLAIFSYSELALVLLGATAVALVWNVYRRRAVAAFPWSQATRWANAVAAITLLLTSLVAGAAIAGTPAEQAASARPSVGTGPDVYVLLLDGYPRADTLVTELGHDNSTFLDQMSGMGFDVAEDSRANYNMTILTVASMLNGRLVHELIPDAPDSAFAQYRTLARAINSARLLDVMRSLGYETITIPSPFSSVTVYGADRVLDSGDATEFESSLIQRGRLRNVLPEQQRTLFVDSLRHRIETAFRTLGELAAERRARPKFVFAHIMSPHPPYIFRSDGGGIEPACFPQVCPLFHVGDLYGDALPSLVSGQIDALNRKVVDTVEQILDASTEPPVIIVMSDHGHRHDMLDRRESLRSLFMAYTPGHPDLFPADVSPVNALTRVLNAYHRTALPLSPEGGYFVDRRSLGTLGPLAMEPVP